MLPVYGLKVCDPFRLVLAPPVHSGIRLPVVQHYRFTCPMV